MPKFLFKELEDLNKKASNSSIPEGLRERIGKMLERLNRMAKLGGYTAEFESVARYVDWVVSIHWGEETKDNLDIQHAKEVLNKYHYGLEDVKERVLEYIAIKQLRGEKGAVEGSDKALLAEDYHAPILCLVGLQGIGKTTMAASIAKALGREFVRVSLGAVGSVLELRGQSRANQDSEPGQIIKSLVRTKVMNPLILLDEMDKVSGEKGLRSDVMAALLEILDPEQNTTFRDHYIDYPVNLSKVMFVCSANNTGGFSTALMDRLEIIRMPAYTDEEKRVIAQNYLFPKVIANSGLDKEQLRIEEDTWEALVRPLGFDTGIRSLQRNLEAITRRVAKQVVEGKTEKVVINNENLKEYLTE